MELKEIKSASEKQHLDHDIPSPELYKAIYTIVYLLIYVRVCIYPIYLRLYIHKLYKTIYFLMQPAP